MSIVKWTRNVKNKFELFNLKDPSLAEDPCAHPFPDVDVVEEFEAADFDEAIAYADAYSKTHPGCQVYWRMKHDKGDYGLWHIGGICSFGFGDVDEWFLNKTLKHRKAFKDLKKSKPTNLPKDIFKLLRYQKARKDILVKIARIKKMSTCKVLRLLVKAWVSICNWCEWWFKDKWVDMIRNFKWEREKLRYWKKNHHSPDEWWSLEAHLLRDLKWNLKRIVNEGYGISTEFIKEVLVKEHGNEPGFDLDSALEAYFCGKPLFEMDNVDKKAVDLQKSTYEFIIHLVDLHTFYLNQEIDDEDAFTSKSRTDDMKPIFVKGTYDMLDYKAMYAKSQEYRSQIWDMVKKYGPMMGD